MLAPETGIDASPVEPVSTEQGTEVFRHRVAPRADTAVQSWGALLGGKPAGERCNPVPPNQPLPPLRQPDSHPGL